MTRLYHAQSLRHDPADDYDDNDADDGSVGPDRSDRFYLDQRNTGFYE